MLSICVHPAAQVSVYVRHYGTLSRETVWLAVFPGLLSALVQVSCAYPAFQNKVYARLYCCRLHCALSCASLAIGISLVTDYFSSGELVSCVSISC